MGLKNKRIVLRRHIITAKNNIKRNRKRFFLPVLTIFITLTFVSFLLTGVLNVGSAVYNLTKNTQITVLLEGSGSNVIKKQISQISSVKNVEYLSKDDQLERLSDLLSKDWQGFKGQQNPLKNSYVATVSNSSGLDSVEKKLESVKGVQLATDNRADNESVARNTTAISVILLVVGIATLVFSSTSIASVIELSLSSREDEIEIMRLLGATKKFVRTPFEIEGAVIGLFGSLPSVVLNVVFYLWFYNMYGNTFKEQGFVLVEPLIDIFIVTVVVVLVGTWVGSMSAKFRSNRVLEF